VVDLRGKEMDKSFFSVYLVYGYNNLVKSLVALHLGATLCSLLSEYDMLFISPAKYLSKHHLRILSLYGIEKHFSFILMEDPLDQYNIVNSLLLFSSRKNLIVILDNFTIFPLRIYGSRRLNLKSQKAFVEQAAMIKHISRKNNTPFILTAPEHGDKPMYWRFIEKYVDRLYRVSIDGEIVKLTIVSKDLSLIGSYELGEIEDLVQEDLRKLMVNILERY